ncbi:peptidoglycan-binding domain-containing protein [Roseibium sp.]|uniref:peptidoglycan-binding domain-containing protein n=1 Tax=Roseibium sp. TaxID=1936156 RepID=UPI003BA8FE76
MASKSLSASNLQSACRTSAGWILAGAVLIAILGCGLLYVADRTYDRQNRYLNTSLPFNFADTKSFALRSSSEANILFENRFFSERVRQSRHVMESSKIIEEHGHVVSNRFFSNLWQLLSYLHAVSNTDAAAIIEVHHADSGALWSLPECENFELTSSRCNSEYVNQTNMSAFFEHVVQFYIKPALVSFQTGQLAQGYSKIRTADEIIRNVDIGAHDEFDYGNLNKAYILNSIVMDIYHGVLDFGWQDLYSVSDVLEYTSFEDYQIEISDPFLSRYMAGLHALQNNCFMKASREFAAGYQELSEQDKRGRLSELFAFMTIRSMVKPLTDMRKQSLNLQSVNMEAPDLQSYAGSLLIEDCGEVRSQKDSRRLALKAIERFSRVVEHVGLKRDIKEYRDRLTSSGGADPESIKAHMNFMCSEDNLSSGRKYFLARNATSEDRLEPYCERLLRRYGSQDADGEEFFEDPNDGGYLDEFTDDEPEQDADRLGGLPVDQGRDTGLGDEQQPEATRTDVPLPVLGSWIQVHSKRAYSEAEAAARQYQRELETDVSVFEHRSGWFVVAIGPFGEGGAEKWRDVLSREGRIPEDSKVKNGTVLGDLVWGKDAVLVINIQSELERLGCRPGVLDGDWGPKTKQALETVFGRSSFQSENAVPSLEILDLLKAKNGRYC